MDQLQGKSKGHLGMHQYIDRLSQSININFTATIGMIVELLLYFFLILFNLLKFRDIADMYAILIF